MYHVSAQGIDERMINVHYYYCSLLSCPLLSCPPTILSPYYLVPYYLVPYCLVPYCLVPYCLVACYLVSCYLVSLHSFLYILVSLRYFSLFPFPTLLLRYIPVPLRSRSTRFMISPLNIHLFFFSFLFYPSLLCLLSTKSTGWRYLIIIKNSQSAFSLRS